MASIRPRTNKDGSITFSVLWRDPDTRKQKSWPFADHQSAENFRRILTANKGQLAPTQEMIAAIEKRSPTITAIVEHHITTLTTANPRTRADYRRDARNHIDPYLGHVPIATLTKARMQQYLGELSATDLSDKTIANVHGLLSAAIGTAVEDGHVQANVSKGLRLPRRSDHDDQEMTFLTPDDWHVLDGELGKGGRPYMHLLFRTLIGTGMRFGEATALRKSDLHLRGDTPSIRIVRAVKRDETGGLYIGVTKTRRAVRTVSITAELAAQLREHVASLRPDDLVFAGPGVPGRGESRGALLHSSNVRDRAWRPAIERAQNPKLHPDDALTVTPRIHDLRHSHASWLIAAGVDLLTVQRRLGHESIKTTADRYSHLMPGQQKAAADAIAAALG